MNERVSEWRVNVIVGQFLSSGEREGVEGAIRFQAGADPPTVWHSAR